MEETWTFWCVRQPFCQCICCSTLFFSGRFGFILERFFGQLKKVLRWYRLACRRFEVSKIYGESRKGLASFPLGKWKNSQHEPTNKIRIPFFDVLRSRNLKRPNSCSCASSLCILPTNESADGEAIQMELWKRFQKNTVTPLSWDQRFAAEFHHVAFGTLFKTVHLKMRALPVWKVKVTSDISNLVHPIAFW